MTDPIDDMRIDVDALIAVGIDPATFRTAVNQAEAFGKNFGSGIAGAANKAFASIGEDVAKALTGTKSKGERDRALRDISTAYRNLAKEVLAAAQQIDRAVGSTGAAAGRVETEARQVGDAFEAAAASARRMAAGANGAFDKADVDADALVRSILKINAATQGSEEQFTALSAIISAALAKARTEFAVTEQSVQQLRGVVKQQERLTAQALKDSNRAAFQEQKAADRQREQERAASLRSSLASQKSALAQENAAYNASLQSNLVAEKGFQQRRTALVQAGLLATRSLYQGLASGTSSVISGVYSAILSATRRGEDQVTAANRKGLEDRRRQTQQITQQTIADIRREQGAAAAAQQQLATGGVLGAATGQSAAGNLLRGGLFGAGAVGGALGVRQLFGEASDFEANLRVFAALNDELGDTPAILEEIRQLSLDLGNDIALPGVSAGDAAAAITALAKTGLSLDDSMEAARGSLLLARGAGIDFAESARTIGSTLNALGLEGENATAVVDGFTAALKESGGATFDELRQAQAQALLVFKQGFKFADDPLEIMNNLNTSLALFSKNALRGSDAGTSLKTFVASLTGISGTQRDRITEILAKIGESGNFLFDASGRARDFSESIDLVRRAFLNLDPAERGIAIRDIFGSDAQRAAEIFVNTSKEELDALSADIAASAGLTEKLAKAQNQGLRAAGDAFVSTIETIFTQLFRLVDKPLGKIVETIAGALSAIASDPAFRALRGALFGIATALGSILAVKGGIEVIRLLGTLLAGFATPLGAVVLALSAVGGAIGFVLAQSEPLREALGRVFDRLKEAGSGPANSALGKIRDFFDDIRAKVERAAEVVGFFITLLIDDDIRKRFIEWQGLDPNVENEGIFGWFLRARKEIPNLIDTVRETFGKVVGFIRDVATDPSFELLRSVLVSVAGSAAGLVVAIKGLSVARTALSGLRNLAGVVGAFANPLGIAAIAVGALVAGFVVLYRKSEPFRDLVDGIVDVLQDVVKVIIDGARPAFEAFVGVLKTAGQGALKIFFEALKDVADFLSSPGFIGALSSVGAFLGDVFTKVAQGFQRVVDFVRALARTINELGVFEGLRQGVTIAFEGIVGFVGDIFSRIGRTISGFFSGINWGQVAATAALGIFQFFREVGNAVGRFIGSKEFLTVLSAALATIAGVLASAAGGLITGFIEGLRDSDAGQQIQEFFRELIGLGSDEIEGAGDVIAEAIRNLLFKGLETALSLAFPPGLFVKLITDPLDTALGGAVLVVEALFIGKIVRLFVGGFQTISRTIQGIALAPRILQGGLASISDDLAASGRAARNNAADLNRFSNQYGGFAGKVAGAADKLNGLGKSQEQAAETGQRVVKSMDGQTAALLRNEAAGRANVAQIGVQNEELKKGEQAANKTRDALLGLAGATAGGVLGGFSIGRLLTADNPLQVIEGITGAIAGIGTVAVTTAQVVASSGLTAGLLTGGVGLAVFAITAAVTFFTSRKNDMKAASDAAAAAAESYVRSFRQIIDITGGSRAQTAVTFLKELVGGESEVARDFGGAIRELGLDFEAAARGVTGTEEAYTSWAQVVQGAIDSNASAIEDAERRRREILESSDVDASGFGNVDLLAVNEELDLLRQRRDVLLGAQGTIEATRAAYEDALEISDETLLIEQNLRDIEAERKSIAEKVLEDRRTERDLVDEITAKMRDLIDLERGRRDQDRDRAERGAVRSFIDTVVPTTNEDGSVTAAPGDLAALFAGGTTEEADAAGDALRRLQDEFAATAAQAAIDAGTYTQYVKNLGEEQATLIQTLIAEGLNPDQARQVAELVFGPFQDQAAFTVSAVSIIGEELDTLGVKLRGLDAEPIILQVQDEQARTALQTFVEEPEEKNIQALIDLGLPTFLLQAFVENPTEKSIQAIVETFNAQQELQNFISDGVLSEKEIDVLANIGVARSTLEGFMADGVLDQKEIDILVDEATRAAAALQMQALTAPETKTITVEAVIGEETFRKISERFRGLQGQTIVTGERVRNNKYGSIITAPTLSWLGEENRKEVVIPLTMPNRAAQLYEQSGLANVLARAGVVAPGVQRVVQQSGGGPDRIEFDRLVTEVHLLREDLREDMDTRRDNVFVMESVEDPYPSVRERAATLRRPKKRRR